MVCPLLQRCHFTDDNGVAACGRESVIPHSFCRAPDHSANCAFRMSQLRPRFSARSGARGGAMTPDVVLFSGSSMSCNVPWERSHIPTPLEPGMRRAIRALAATGLLAAASLTAFVVAGPASADTQICDQYGSTTIEGRYIVMNNRWGTSAQQCINVTSTGFSIASQQGTGSTSGAPVSYPAVYYGCHYTNCSPGTSLPMQLSAITSATSSIDYTFVSGATFDASYDIWLDPSPKKDGVNQQEVMIWFNRQGSIQPIGSVVGSATIGGRTRQGWDGRNVLNEVVLYTAPLG